MTRAARPPTQTEGRTLPLSWTAATIITTAIVHRQSTANCRPNTPPAFITAAMGTPSRSGIVLEEEPRCFDSPTGLTSPCNSMQSSPPPRRLSRGRSSQTSQRWTAVQMEEGRGAWLPNGTHASARRPPPHRPRLFSSYFPNGPTTRRRPRGDQETAVLPNVYDEWTAVQTTEEGRGDLAPYRDPHLRETSSSTSWEW